MKSLFPDSDYRPPVYDMCGGRLIVNLGHRRCMGCGREDVFDYQAWAWVEKTPADDTSPAALEARHLVAQDALRESAKQPWRTPAVKTAQLSTPNLLDALHALPTR